VWTYSARSSLQNGFAMHVHIITAFTCVRTGLQNTMVQIMGEQAEKRLCCVTDNEKCVATYTGFKLMVMYKKP
jgi:hypothetical protein